MGNLELAKQPEKIVTRKPIFQSEYHNETSRSLSSCPLRTPRSNLNRSSIHGNTNKLPQNNKVYISPRMIRSVIKDNNNEKRDEYKNKKSINKYKNNPYFLMSKSVLGPRMETEYHEKSFQRIHGSKDKMESCIRSSILLRESLEKEVLEHRIRESEKYNRIDPSDQLLNSHSRSPLKYNHFLKSGNSSGKISSLEDKRYFQDEKNEHNFMWKGVNAGNESVLEEGSIMDNTLTERKKPVRLFDSTANQFMDKNRKLKQSYFQDSSSETFRNDKENISNPTLVHQENREKCQEIIKRVRNFNEFLNEVKLKLKKETEIATSQNNTMSSMSIDQSRQFNHNQSINTSVEHTNSIGSEYTQTHNKSITLALKLENEKIELEKYKKLVERELSKQHSIESIEIEGGRNKEKIITINFEGKLAQDKFKPIQIYPNSDTSAKQDFSKIELIKEEDSTKESALKESKIINQRVSNITKLMNKIEGISKEQSQNCFKISEFLRSEECENDDDQ